MKTSTAFAILAGLALALANAPESRSQQGGITLAPFEVGLVSPEDGGFPREASKLVRVVANHYRIDLPSAEDSHIMLEATNPSREVASLTLDFNPDPTAKKDHFYYRTPQGRWFRKHLERGQPRLVVPAEPGTTRIAGVPWFTYGEYIAYVESLNDPRLTKAVAYTDEGGKYKVYRLTITSAGGVRDLPAPSRARQAGKLKIAYGRAHHANETSGFFMMQGMIDWLLSGDPAANLNNIEWTFYPCQDAKAIHDHYKYNEIEKELYDGGKTALDTQTEEFLARRYHMIWKQHLWNNEHGGMIHGLPSMEIERFCWADPTVKTSLKLYPRETPTSPIWEDFIAYCPLWFEYGTDTFEQWSEGLCTTHPGTLCTGNEILFFGKESGGDLIANMKELGKQWARATAQVYLRFQKRTQYWTERNPNGAVDVTGAVFLPKPVHTLLEDVVPLAGAAAKKANANGEPMVIYRKTFAHGLGMSASQSVTFAIPARANSFKANVAMDDSDSNGAATLEFVVKIDGKEAWRSRPLKKFESQLAHVALPGTGSLTLTVQGPNGVLANWGGARFTVNDPDKPTVGPAPDK